MTRRDAILAGALLFVGIVLVGFGLEVMWHGTAYVLAGAIVLAVAAGMLREGGL